MRAAHDSSAVRAGRVLRSRVARLQPAARAPAGGSARVNIGVVGTGYVGLVVGACLAENGNTVVCVDNDEAKVDALCGAARSPSTSRASTEMVPRNVAEERLALHDRPRGRGAGERRCSSSRWARRRTRTARRTCATCSRWPEGIGARHERLQGRGQQVHGAGGHRGQGRGRSIAALTKHPFAVVSNPEFLKEGAAVDDFLKPDRVVIGTDDPQGRSDHARALRALRAHRQPDPGHGPRLRRADQVRGQRHARHPHLVHERDREPTATGWAPTCARCAWAWARTSRIGPSFLFPGVGYGGSCFPKDVKALLRMGAGRGRRARTSWRRWTRPTSAQKRDPGARASTPTWAGSTGKVVAVWGLAFKPRTDDMREAPALAADRGAARGRRDACAPTIPRPCAAAPARPRRPRHALRAQLRGGGGGGRPGGGHGVERVPRARLRAHQVAHAAARDLRRPQHLQPRSACASWASTTRGSAGGEGAGHRRRGLHRQPRRPRAPRRRPRGRRARRPLEGAPRGGARRRAAGRRATSATPRCCARALAGVDGGHPLRRAPERGGVGRASPLAYYRINVGQGAGPARRRWTRAGVRRIIFSSTCATYGMPVRVPMDETHPQDPINPYGASKRAFERALRDHRARRACCGRWPCATSTPRAAIPTARSARTTIPRSTSSRWPSTPRSAARPALTIYGERLRHARRDLHPRLHPRAGPGARPRAGARGAGRRRRLPGLQPGHGDAATRCARWCGAVERVAGRAVPAQRGPAPAGRSAAARGLGARRSAQELGFTPRLAELDDDRGDRAALAARPPAGLRSDRRVSRGPRRTPARRPAALRGDARLQRAAPPSRRWSGACWPCRCASS